MLVKNCYSYILIGLSIRILRNIEDTDTKEFVIKAIDDLYTALDSGNFEVTLAAMKSVNYANMREDIEALEDDDPSVGAALAKKINAQFTKIETVVFPEASIKKIYILPNRRFNTDYLLDHPEKLLAAEIFNKLDDIAQHDIKSACRCLLFGEATAAAFHILRATEAVLKSYYFHHRKKIDYPLRCGQLWLIN